MSEHLAKFLCRNPVPGTVGDYAVFITKEDPGDGSGPAAQLGTYLGQCSMLRQWAASDGGLSDAAEGLGVLERLLPGGTVFLGPAGLSVHRFWPVRRCVDPLAVIHRSAVCPD